MSFYDNLKRLCKEKGTSPSAIAKQIGLGNSAATYWKRGSLPKYETVLSIAAALDCDPWTLVPAPHQSTPESRRQVEELIGKEPGYLDAPISTEQEKTEKRVQRVRAAFDAMSQDGQEEATRRVEELARLPEYQKKESPSLSSLWGFDRRGKDAVDPKENE